MGIFNKVNTVASHNKVWILWVPGDIGSGKDAADEVSRTGVEKSLNGVEVSCGIGTGFMVMTTRKEEEQGRGSNSQRGPRIEKSTNLDQFREGLPNFPWYLQITLIHSMQPVRYCFHSVM